jgi:hypothetical protein
VPLQLGDAFTSAAQHSWNSVVTHTVANTLRVLLLQAAEAGICRNAGNNSLASSIRQQLQQSGMLQQLAAVMTAMAAEMQTETAALPAGVDAGAPSAGVNTERFTGYNTVQQWFVAVAYMQSHVCKLWDCQDPPATWLWGPTGHVATVLQWTFTALQHVSAVVQHVLPTMQERAPQQAGTLQSELQDSVEKALGLCHWVASGHLGERPPAQQGQDSGEDGLQHLQQLLLSPHLLPCIAAALVLCATRMNCSSSGDGSSSSSSGGAVSDTPPGCQLQLLQLLGLAPDLTAWHQQQDAVPSTCEVLFVAAKACLECCSTSWEQQIDITGPSHLDLQQQRQWDFEAQLWLLLPTVLLPCASSLLSHSTPDLGLQQQDAMQLVQQLLQISREGVPLSVQLQRALGQLAAQPSAAWVQEMLDVTLRLADQLLCQQQPSAAAGTAAAAAQGRAGSSTGSNSRREMRPQTNAVCVVHLLELLSDIARTSQPLLYGPSRSDNSRPRGADGAAVLPPVATKFVGFAASLEAALRAVSAALPLIVQSGTGISLAGLNGGISVLCADMLLTRSDQTHSVLMQQMGLCGPAALAQEQRQLYSLLSTVLKMGHRESAAADACLNEGTKSACCCSAGQAAVGLLTMASPAGTGGQAAAGQHAAATAAPAAQLPAVDCLPSLVIVGRCCLQWAQQVQQLAPKLLLLNSAASEQPEQGQEQLNALLNEYSVAVVCIPSLQQTALSIGVVRSNTLESVIGAVSGWVGGLGSSAASAFAQLKAAGCAPQQLQQQLQALLAAQHASLALLEQQLQATGAMLCNIAVPHFCNNPACANISGPTEVRLVSGRSCICAGCCTARYCGRDCQRAAWQHHKPVCKALAAAGVVAPGVATPSAVR